jgi:hypothetical protein
MIDLVLITEEEREDDDAPPTGLRIMDDPRAITEVREFGP